MHLHWIDRTTYRNNKTSSSFLASLAEKFGRFHLLPEGGTNELCLPGCAGILEEIAGFPFQTVICACGTGGTLAGMLTALRPEQSAIGIAVLKNGGFLADDIQRLLGKRLQSIRSPWQIETAYHSGGYAKRPPDLLEFIQEFRAATGIELDPVYTGKMMLGLTRLAGNGAFRAGSRLVAIHTGGLMPGSP
jgi:1-aminocyclopropane-1-carboxylate deaminase/D-cysteine desulfhydrase-like pyridoxal-dependent ACC family enzyme